MNSYQDKYTNSQILKKNHFKLLIQKKRFATKQDKKFYSNIV